MLGMLRGRLEVLLDVSQDEASALVEDIDAMLTRARGD